MRRVLSLLVFSALLGCTAASKSTTSPLGSPKKSEAKRSPLAAKEGNELTLDGPKESLAAFCGEGDGTCSKAQEQALSGELLAYALLDNEGVFNAPRLALKTSAGWFVEAYRSRGFTPSHHEPSSEWFDAAKLRVEDGVLTIPRTFSQSVFLPGQGNDGASHSTSTTLYSCAVWEARVQCKVK